MPYKDAKKRNEATMKSHKKNPESERRAQRKYHLKKNYGLTLEEYQELFDKQRGCCAICERPLVGGRGTHIDHCHTTKRVRGLLCSQCNVMLGMAQDNVDVLLAAVAYLSEE